MSARRLELACWIAALVFVTLLAAGNTSATAGAESHSALSSSGERATAAALLRSMMPSKSSGWCIKEVIESVPRWPSSHDLTNAIDRQCFPRPQPMAVRARTAKRATCIQALAWRPKILAGRVTGCLLG